jgi:hypothetical protein
MPCAKDAPDNIAGTGRLRRASIILPRARGSDQQPYAFVQVRRLQLVGVPHDRLAYLLPQYVALA